MVGGGCPVLRPGNLTPYQAVSNSHIITYVRIVGCGLSCKIAGVAETIPVAIYPMRFEMRLLSPASEKPAIEKNVSPFAVRGMGFARLELGPYFCSRKMSRHSPCEVQKMPKNSRPEPEARAAATGIDWQGALLEHGHWLRNVVAARLGEPQAIDEVMQEVSLAAVRQKAPIDDPQKVAPWLYRLAVRQTLLYRRKQGPRGKKKGRYADRFQPTEADNRQADPLGWLLAEERGRLVRAAMSRLPPRDAEILMLKYNEDWSYHAIADHLGVSHSAVETRLHRARQRLRDELAADDVVTADG
jgi:RNA polymerase sigma factor (sigma-70 family)